VIVRRFKQREIVPNLLDYKMLGSDFIEVTVKDFVTYIVGKGLFDTGGFGVEYEDSFHGGVTAFLFLGWI
jgi:hypothetical protein